MGKSWWKKFHNWFGLSSAVFLVVLLATGILLNHPSLIQKEEIGAMAADPSNPQKIYLAKKDGLFLSQDSGKNWDEAPMLYPPQEATDIVFAPENINKIYLLEKWGRVLVSNDGGKIWDTLPLPFDPQAEGIELKQISPGKEALILLTSNGWLSSKDSGKNWDQSHFNPKQKSLHRLILTLHNGYFFGPKFVWVYDFSAAALLILIVTGIYLWKIGRTVI